MLNNPVAVFAQKHSLLFLFLLLSLLSFGQSVYAGLQPIDGYMGAQFGMSAEQVLDNIRNNGFNKLSDEVHEGDREIQASRDRGWIKTNLVYVLPKGRDRLALVIEIYPGVVSDTPLVSELKQAYGKPLAKEVSDEIMNELKQQQMPNLVGLTIWAAKINDSDRLLRLLNFTNHIAIEYFVPDMLN